LQIEGSGNELFQTHDRETAMITTSSVSQTIDYLALQSINNMDLLLCHVCLWKSPLSCLAQNGLYGSLTQHPMEMLLPIIFALSMSKYLYHIKNTLETDKDSFAILCVSGFFMMIAGELLWEKILF
jgi:hypothetical protein